MVENELRLDAARAARLADGIGCGQLDRSVGGDGERVHAVSDHAEEILAIADDSLNGDVGKGGSGDSGQLAIGCD